MKKIKKKIARFNVFDIDCCCSYKRYSFPLRFYKHVESCVCGTKLHMNGIFFIVGVSWNSFCVFFSVFVLMQRYLEFHNVSSYNFHWNRKSVRWFRVICIVLMWIIHNSEWIYSNVYLISKVWFELKKYYYFDGILSFLYLRIFFSFLFQWNILVCYFEFKLLFFFKKYWMWCKQA